jgi:hypothetical protein
MPLSVTPPAGAEGTDADGLRKAAADERAMALT